MTVVTFSLFRFATLRKRLWAFSQMGLAKPGLSATPDLSFFKLMGTGSGAGFSTRPNFGVYTLLAQWPSLDIARERIASASSLSGYRSNADQMATLYLEPVSTRGNWDGHHFPIAEGAGNQTMPVVALTRASIRPSKLIRFWSKVPAISATVEAENMRQFMIGTGEIPWLHQVTLSVWQSIEAMESFSRNSATHGEAVRCAYSENWFSEYCFTRFNLLSTEGQWQGLTGLTGQDKCTPTAFDPDCSGGMAKAARAIATG
ncbi:spheroidene monooxygenase [Hoeflea sp. AS60]|uniref:spheroidene monooxygenase n=1 Tax=Hoeflea sp. AS60 TaxID=3135780 RepID=UPI00317FFF20